MNAIAGGATFFTFPAMVAVGIPPDAANATALVPARAARRGCRPGPPAPDHRHPPPARRLRGLWRLFRRRLGIMLLAGLSLAGLEELRVANAPKNSLSALVNGVAVALFVTQGIVVWPATLAMMAGAGLGGFAGARIARRLPQRLFRALVILVGSLLSLWYFVSG